MKIRALVSLVLVASLGLAGCTAGTGGGSTGGGTAGGGQSGQSDGNDTSTDSGTTDNGLSEYEGLPETFPSDEIPIIGGDVAFGLDLGTGWSVVIPVTDVVAAYQDASAKLTGAGFVSQLDQTTADGSIGVFTTDKYQINLTAADTPDYGLAVSYVVVLLG